MVARILFAAALVAVHSFTPAFASDDASTITTPPAPKRTPSSHHDIAKRQATTYETNSPLPLTQYLYPYSAVPDQVNPFPVGRGPQSGYNKCNSTTEGDNSQCQTLVVNSLADFCLWGSPKAQGTIGDVEAAVVAYCAKAGHGGRVMPPGTITGAQFMKTKAYIQITGRFNQSGIGLTQDDTGGELDPHGADLAGNPLGGLVYSSGLPSAKDNSTLLQAVEWNNFVGGGTFCIKLCDPTVTSPNYCQNIYDLLGCTFNMPAAYTDNEFTSCEGELQDVVGTYTSNGQTLTWSQPAALDPATSLPFTARIPASSNCVTHSSAELYGGASTTASGSSASGSNTSKGSSSSGSAAGSSSTSSSGAAVQVIVSSAMLIVLGAALVLV